MQPPPHDDARWSEFYTSRRRAVEVNKPSADDPCPSSDTEWSEASLAALSALQGQIARGEHPDDVMANLNAHRVAFARWLVDHGKLSEDTL